jgi:hypothetical protein
MKTPRTARILKFMAGLLAVLVVGYLVIVALALWGFRDRRVTLPTGSVAPLTESQAIELSREALERVGEDASLFEPASYDHDKTMFYARNTLTPYNGYVLWHLRGERALYQFSVQLEQVGSEVRCGVGRCK